MNRLASLLNSENINPQLISDLHKNKDTTPSKEERARRINATAPDAIKAYTPIGWAWSDVQVSQHQQIQTSARQTVSTRRTRHTSQRQTESMDIDPDCSNTQPNNPSRQTRTNNNPPSSQPKKRQKRNPIHFMELTKSPAASLPNSPEPLQPGDNVTTKLWHYKHSTAALFCNVKACNTIFKYALQEVLDWQQISKPKRNTNTTSQTQYKIQLQPVTIEKWALPLFQSTGLKAAKTEPFSRSQKVDDCCQICWSPVSREHPKREKNYDDMPQCDMCQRTYHWKCLTDLNVCSHTARQDAEK